MAAVRRGMVEQGLYEVSRLPLGPADGEESVRLLNPLSADDAWLRRRLLPGLVRLVEGNWANHVEDVRLFEIGTAFAAAGPGERPREERRVAAVLTGRREPRALDRHRRGPLRPLGSEGPVRGRRRSGDSRGGGAS